MSSPANGERRYRVHFSDAVAAEMRRLQRKAALEGRGDEVFSAYREIVRQLLGNPAEFGEPAYRLPAMRMQIRCAGVRPLIVDFGVCEDRPDVFIKGIWLLPKR